MNAKCKSSSTAADSQPSTSHHHQRHQDDFVEFEPFASWDEGPSSSQNDAFFSHSQGFDIPQQSVSRVETPLELQRETSCASLVPETMVESEALQFTKEVDDFGWPVTRKSESKGAPFSSNDVPLLSSAWSEVSSSSTTTSSSASTSVMTHSTNTLTTSIVAVPTHLFEATSAPYYFEADGTLVAMAYPVPDPLMTVTPNTGAGLPQPKRVIPPSSSSSNNTRKVAEVDLSSSTSTSTFDDGFSLSRQESALNASVSNRPQLHHTKTSSPISIPVPVPRQEYLQRKLDTKETASVASTTGRPPRSATSTPPLSPKSSPARPNGAEGKLGHHLMQHHHQNHLKTSTSSLTEDEESLDSRGGFLYLPQQQQQQQGTGDASFHSSSGSWTDGHQHKLKQQRRHHEGRGVSSNASAASGDTARSHDSIDYETYMTLQKDVAYRHAVSAGYLWQSLVGQHVRFPSAWWNGARGPSMGMAKPSAWMYIARHRVRLHPLLNGLVPQRNSPGQLLLHVVVQDRLTWKPLQDIVLGCFHPNARGVRTTPNPVPENDTCREVWMAVRKRGDDVSVVDHLLAEGEKLEHCARKSPLLGSQHHVQNVNLKAIFGETPPQRTMFVTESDLHTQLVEAADHAPTRPVALLLLDQAFAKRVEL